VRTSVPDIWWSVSWVRRVLIYVRLAYHCYVSPHARRFSGNRALISLSELWYFHTAVFSKMSYVRPRFIVDSVKWNRLFWVNCLADLEKLACNYTGGLLHASEVILCLSRLRQWHDTEQTSLCFYSEDICFESRPKHLLSRVFNIYLIPSGRMSKLTPPSKSFCHPTLYSIDDDVTQ
jgi:hypothetical protein